MKTIRITGLVIFISGLLLFLSAPLLTTYKLTAHTYLYLQHYGKVDEKTMPELQKAFSNMYMIEFSSAFGFQKNIRSRILDIQAAQKRDFWDKKGKGELPETAQEWQYVMQDYQVTDLQFWIGRYSSTGFLQTREIAGFFLTFLVMLVGALMYLFAGIKTMGPAGIKNNGVFFQSFSKQGGVLSVLIGSALILMYITLYWFPQYMSPYTALVDPITMNISGSPAGHWSLYGFLYTFAVTVMGIRMFVKYRHSRYQLVRTSSVIFSQLVFAFFLPDFMSSMGYQPYADYKVAWPLKYDMFYDYNMNSYFGSGYGIALFSWLIILTFILVPLITYYVGKRWYCSWLCGCGGLAETFADPWRQQSSKSLKSWKIERYLIHGVLVFVFLTSVITLLNYYTGILGFLMYPLQSWYKFLISMIFAGVVGTGFYPLMGNRIWCRFGCPLAAILGYVQRFHSRFRITTNGGQCISCGNCSTYCEMGIDVRWYAQRGQDIVRSSCVGCGVCSAVCPRGVLNLENGPVNTRNSNPQTVSGLNYPEN